VDPVKKATRVHERVGSEVVDPGNRHPDRAACGDDPAAAPSILVTFETPSGSFIARVVDPVSVDRAREALDEGGSAGIPNGRIVEGDGGG
jgi:hypothetical protein